MDLRVEQLSNLIFEETNNPKLVTTCQRAIKISSFILCGFWFIAIAVFIFAQTYVKDDYQTYVILMSIGGLLLFLGLVCSLVWIVINNINVKRYYLKIYEQKTNDLYKLGSLVFKDIKVFPGINNQLRIEKDNQIYHLDLYKKIKLKTKLIVPQYKTYYFAISKLICEQIARHIIVTIETFWEK